MAAWAMQPSACAVCVSLRQVTPLPVPQRGQQTRGDLRTPGGRSSRHSLSLSHLLAQAGAAFGHWGGVCGCVWGQIDVCGGGLSYGDAMCTGGEAAFSTPW